MTDFDQTELPEGTPPVGRLKRLRTLLPHADRIISHAKAVNVFEVDGKTKVPPEDVRAIAGRRRALEKRLDAFGVPRKSILQVERFPVGTRAAADASPEFWAALEAAMSAVVGVGAAEQAAIPTLPTMGGPVTVELTLDRRSRRDCGGHTARREPEPKAPKPLTPAEVEAQGGPWQHDNGPEDGYRCVYCGSNVNDWPDQPCVPH